MTRKRTLARRDLLTALAAGPLLAAGSAAALQPRRRGRQRRRRAANDRIGLATIGMGIIGFIDTRTALEVDGVELVAAADLYDGRRVRTGEVFGEQVATSADYREILARPDVDAVIISTPDHWHARIAVEALDAGKHVYCEKPMVQTVTEGHEVLAAERRSRRVLQVGSQYAASLLFHKAKELFEAGAIGELNLVEATYNRRSAIGAWQYSLPLDASPQTIDWERFLGHAPKRPFDPLRFFRWRNYWDYGTGIPGDLFVHLLTGIHLITGSAGPTRILATGGLRFWQDGRDVPDVILGLYDYPETRTHPAFTLALQANFADGGGGGSRVQLTGSEGRISIGSSELTVTRLPAAEPSPLSVLKGYNSVMTFSADGQEAFAEEYLAKHESAAPLTPESSRTFHTEPEYDSRLDHFERFFAAVRGGDPVIEDGAYGLRAAAPALLTNTSYREGQAVVWDPEAMKLG